MKWIGSGILLLSYMIVCNASRPGYDACIPIRGFDCVKAGGTCGIHNPSLVQDQFEEKAFTCPNGLMCIFPGMPLCHEIKGSCLPNPAACKAVAGDIFPSRDCDDGAQVCCRPGVQASPCGSIGGVCISGQACAYRRNSASVKGRCPKSGQVCCVREASKCQKIGGSCVTDLSKCKKIYVQLKIKGLCRYSDETCCIKPKRPPKATICDQIGGQCKKRRDCVTSGYGYAKPRPSRFTFLEGLCPRGNGYGYGHNNDEVCCLSQIGFCDGMHGDCVKPHEKCDPEIFTDDTRLELHSCNFTTSNSACCVSKGQECEQIGGSCLYNADVENSKFCGSRDSVYRLGRCGDDDLTCCYPRDQACRFCMRFPDPNCKVWNFNKIFSDCPDKSQPGVVTACCMQKWDSKRPE